MNPYTQTPVNAVWFSVFVAFLLGLLSFAGSVAVGAIFALAVGAQYTAYCLPITARFYFRRTNEFKPGPFSMGRFVSRVIFLHLPGV